MTKFIAVAAAAAVAVLAAAPAFAQDDMSLYGSVGYAHNKLSNTKAKTGDIVGRFGAKFNQYLGAEVEASWGLKGDTVAKNTFKNKGQYAVYGVVYPISTENFDLFARVGYGTTQIQNKGPHIRNLDDGKGVSYGVGGNYFFDGENGVRADWTQYKFDQKGKSDRVSVSYVRKF